MSARGFREILCSKLGTRVASARKKRKAQLEVRGTLANAVRATVESLEQRALLSVTSVSVQINSTTAIPGQQVQLINIWASTDDGGTLDSSYTVHWGESEGEPETYSTSWQPQSDDCPAQASPSATHTYNSSGNYSVEIDVSENGDVACCVVVVAVMPPPTVSISGNPYVAVNSPYTLNTSFSDSLGDSATAWDITWDNFSPTDHEPAQSSYQHTYSASMTGVQGLQATAETMYGNYQSDYLFVNVISAMPTTPSLQYSIANGPGQLYIQWPADPSADGVVGYDLQKSTNGTSWTSVLTNSTSTTYQDTGLASATTYLYRVRAQNVLGTYSGWTSPAKSLTTLADVPTGLSEASGATPLTIPLTWNVQAGAASYVIYRKGPGDSGFHSVGTPTSNSFTDTGLAPQSAYTYEVASVDAGGTSAASSAAGPFTTPAAPSAPTLTANAGSGSSVALSWTASSGTVTAYHVERDSGSGFVEIGTTSSITYPDTTTMPGHTYSYRVRAEWNGSFSGYSNSPAITAVPTPPSVFTVTTLTPVAVSFTWPASFGATSYTVLRKGPGDSGFTQRGSATNSTNFTDSGLTSLATYQYELEATDAGGTSSPGGSLTVNTPATPSAPPSLNGTLGAGPKITLTWGASSGNVTAYHVERSVNGGSFVQVAGNLSNTTLTYPDTNVLAGNTYAYQVRAEWSGAFSAYSSQKTLVLTPIVPTNLSVTATTGTTVALTWTASNGATSYGVRRTKVSDGSFVDLTSNGASYTDTGLTLQTAYTYQVKAVNAGGSSAFTPSVSATTLAIPTAPTNLANTIDSGPQIVLSWTASIGTVTAYHVQRSTDGVNFSDIASNVAGNTTTYTDTSVAAGTPYVYRVYAELSGSYSGYSNTSAVGPAAPGGLSLTGVISPSFVTSTTSSVALSWTPVVGATAYHLERTWDGTNYIAFVDVIPSTTTTYTDVTPLPGVTYTYRVRADRSGFYSAYSNTVQATMAPPTPTNLTGSRSGGGAASLSWHAVVGATTYTVLRQAPGGTSLTSIGTATSTTYTDSSAASGLTYAYEIVASNSAGDSDASTSFTPTVVTSNPAVVGRWIFYNNSALDGNNTAINSSDDSAIAPDKQALLPGQGSTFANISSFSRGINGIMVDVANLAGTPTASDFTFRVGNTSDTSSWTTAPAPSGVSLRTGAGVNGSARVEITWADSSIVNQWIQVTVKANANTGLTSPDVFYFGNLIGASGPQVTNGKYGIVASEEFTARYDAHGFTGPAPLSDPADFNRDGRVDTTDQLIARIEHNASPAITLARIPGGTSGKPYLISVGGGEIQIGWPASTDPNVSSYEVDRTDALNNVVVFSGLTGTSIDDTSAVSGTAYSYVVIAHDANGNSSIPSAAVTVTPTSTTVIQAIPDQFLNEGDPLGISTTFTDTNTSDTHTATIIWGDGTSTSAAVTESSGSGSISATPHSYAMGGLYRVMVVLTDQSGKVAVASFNVSELVPAPSGFAASASGDDTINLSWASSSTSATGFQIQILGSEDSPDQWSYFDDVPAWQFSYAATGLSANQSYSFRVIAENGGGDSTPSASVSATTQQVSAPSVLHVAVASSSELDLSWTGNQSDATGYEIDWSTDGTNFQLLTTVDGSTATYNATELTPGTSYTFQVEAINNAGQSDPSGPQTAETTPAAPMGLNISYDSSGTVNLTWNGVAGATSYVVERQQGGGSWQQLATPSGTGYADTSASAGITYTYRVSAADGNNTSDAGQSVSITLLPPTPTGLTITRTDASHVHLSWTASGNASLWSGFLIEKSTDGFNFTTVQSMAAAARSADVSASQSATFRVSATNPAGHSGYTEATYTPASTTISFGPSSLGTVVTNQFANVTFSSPSGYTFQVFSDPPNRAGEFFGSSSAFNQGVTLTFAIPVNQLSFVAGYFNSPTGSVVGSVNVYSGTSLLGTTNMVSPGNNTDGTTDLSAYHDVTKIVIGANSDLAGLGYTSFSFDSVSPPQLTAYRTGNNIGTPVSTTVQHNGDPSQYLMLVSNQNDPQTSLPFNTETTIPVSNDQLILGTDGKPLDPDLAKITLHQIPQGLASGTATISFSDSSAARFFDKNGQLLTQTSLNLASPSGYLAGLTSGNVDVWVEGMHKAGDLVIKFAFVDVNGNDISRDTVHMQIAQWSFIGKDGNAIASVKEDALPVLQDYLAGDVNVPQMSDDVYYKIRIDGLGSESATSLTVRSDSNIADFYNDTFDSSMSEIDSANWGVIYNTPDSSTDLSSSQILELEQHDNINAVKDGNAEATLKTGGGDSVSRALKSEAPTYTAQDLYTWLTTDTNYGDKVKFVLDRMDWNNTGDTFAKRLVISDFSGLVGTYYDGKLFVPDSGTQEQKKECALSALREFAYLGEQGVAGTNSRIPSPYFAGIARQWARQFYWQPDATVPVPMNDLTKPTGDKLTAYHGTRKTVPDANASVESLASTLDFLYFFSRDAEGPNSTQKIYMLRTTEEPVGILNLASTHHRKKPPAPTPYTVALPEVYLWVFDNRPSIFYPSTSSGFAVNIPSFFGMNVDYWESATRTNPNGSLQDSHDTTSEQVLRSDGTVAREWKDEDQLHHFAGYFSLGAWIAANNYPFANELGETKSALGSTGDYPRSNNPGDYALGLVGIDIGKAFQSSPGYSNSPNILIWQDLQTSETNAYRNDGRTIIP